jgi:hypothetical protein
VQSLISHRKKKEKPAPPCPVSVGDMGFHKSLNVVNNKPMSDKKILVRVMNVEWDSGSGKWCVLLENRGDILPREAAWWEDANKVELPLTKGTEVMVKVNTGWVEGVVEGVERDDGELMSFPIFVASFGEFSRRRPPGNMFRWIDELTLMLGS